jgi:sec-independent protein translocase protein TatC
VRDKELTIRGHLEELRRRLLVAVIAVVIVTGVSFAFYRQILGLLLLPATGFTSEPAPMVYTEVTEMVAVVVKVCFLAGLVGAFPVILYEVIMFVAPGLTASERRYLFAFLPATLLAFAAGVVFGYFLLIPPALRFLLSFGSDIATPLIRISNYVNVALMLLFWIGLSFEMPLVMFLLARLGVVSVRGFARWRRYWIVMAFVLGALITPTFDPVNQSLVAVPLILLYELGLLLARLARRRPAPLPGRAEASGPPS